MKLSSLFSRYLYQQKQLSLPGIGIFSIDSSLPVPDTTDKNFAEFVKQIQYRQQTVTQSEDQFIDYIRTQTGKIRPLAESDLDSFLSDAKILLNIGKPFHLEGIGTLQKNNAGRYDFVPGEPNLSRLEPHPVANQEIKSRVAVTETSTRGAFGEENQESNKSRSLLIGLAVVIGLVLVVWLGYGLYSRNTAEAPAIADTIAIAPADTGRANIILDSVQKIIDSTSQQRDSVISTNAPVTAGSYRFVIEKTANKIRAIKRYNQLTDNLTSVKMDANADSTAFSLYFTIAASPADTTRIRDSLKVWYGRKQVWVE